MTILKNIDGKAVSAYTEEEVFKMKDSKVDNGLMIESLRANLKNVQEEISDLEKKAEEIRELLTKNIEEKLKVLKAKEKEIQEGINKVIHKE